MPKSVSFSDNNLIYESYSSDDYDRSSIDHVLYRYSYNRISQSELKAIYITLDLYKLYNMPVHVESLKNNNYYIKHIL